MQTFLAYQTCDVKVFLTIRRLNNVKKNAVLLTSENDHVYDFTAKSPDGDQKSDD